jgi:hypothetical protein
MVSRKGGKTPYIEQSPCQRRCKVEAEPVNLHFGGPVPQAVHYKLQGTAAEHVQGVARTGIVGIIKRMFLFEPVIMVVVDSPESQRWPHVISFGSMVIYHIEEDFNARPVVSLYHFLEFVTCSPF